MGKTVKKTKAKKVPKIRIPKEYVFKTQNVVVKPPPKALEKCPRCEKPHKKLSPRKFARPMYFFAANAKKGDKPINAASHWALCPKLKEPVVLMDQYDYFETTAKMTVNAMAWSLGAQEDKKVLDEINKLTKSAKPKASVIRVRYKGGRTQKWVHDSK